MRQWPSDYITRWFIRYVIILNCKRKWKHIFKFNRLCLGTTKRPKSRPCAAWLYQTFYGRVYWGSVFQSASIYELQHALRLPRSWSNEIAMERTSYLITAKDLGNIDIHLMVMVMVLIWGNIANIKLAKKAAIQVFRIFLNSWRSSRCQGTWLMVW